MSDFSRRQWLEGAALAGVAAATGGSAETRVLAIA